MRYFFAGIMLLGRLSGADWPMYLLNLEHRSYVDSDAGVNAANAASLAPAWEAQAGRGFAAAPIVVDGVLYVGSWDGHFYALDALTGDLKWKTYVGQAPPPENPACEEANLGVSGSAVVRGDVVYVPGGDAKVYALDKSTGVERWSAVVGDPALGTYLWSSLLIHKDQLYVGIASLGDCPMVRGAMARFDLNSVKAPVLPDITHFMPEGEIGGGLWTTPAVNTATGEMFITTGNSDMDRGPGRWDGALLKMAAGSGEIKTAFFIPSNLPETDMDWGSSPVLFEASDGTPLVGANGKDGWLYALKQDDLSPVWKTQVAMGCISPEQGCGSLSTPAFDGVRLYVAGGVAPDEEDLNGGSAWALDPDTGEVIWERHLVGTVIAPPTVTGGVMLLSTLDGVEALDAATGETLWRSERRYAIYSQPVLAMGMLYVTWVDGRLTAYRAAAQ